MTTSRSRRVAVVLLLSIAACWKPAAAGPGRATVPEYRKTIRTYPFSDPNPIAAVGRIYPYFRFDGYTDVAADRPWTAVELENDGPVTILLESEPTSPERART